MKMRMAACLILALGFSVRMSAAQAPIPAGSTDDDVTIYTGKQDALTLPYDPQEEPRHSNRSSSSLSRPVITVRAEEPAILYGGKKKVPVLPDISKEETPRKNTLPQSALAAGGGEDQRPPMWDSHMGCPHPPGRVWIGADLLLWWTRGEHLPPLLTTSPTGTPETQAGVLGQPGTTVLFGDQIVDGGIRPGIRATLGGWLNDAHSTGIEANFFCLGTVAAHYSAASEGDPILARPFIFENPNDPRFGQEGSLKVAYPGLVRGNFDARTSSGFLGTDVYLRQELCCGCCGRLDVLAGYRYLRLRDGLEISETEIATNPASIAFGIPFVMNEGFETRNEFNGGEIGLIGECMRNRWILRGWAKVAFGSTERTADVHGTININGAQQNGGFLALPSNIGQFESTVFSVVPEAGLELGYAVLPRLRVFTGFTFLYWTGVARPGDQIDLRVNASQPPLGMGLVGQPLPAFNFHSTDFWAMGLNFGVELRF